MRLRRKPNTRLKVEDVFSKVNQAEVTEIIINPTKRTSYHETFMSSIDHCEYKGKTYNEPVGEAQHYGIGLWNFGRKLSMHFSQHTTQARFFDWFHFAENVSYPIGFVHEENSSEPLEFKVNNPDNFVDPSQEIDTDIKDHLDEYTTLEENAAIDWSKINYAVAQNRTIEGMHEDVDNLLGNGAPRIKLNLLLLIAIIAVCVVVAAYFLGGNHSETVQHQVTNITATVAPRLNP